jgi:hypothetical protein
MTRVICTLPFLQDSRHFEGEVQVIEVTENDQPHIYLRMRIGKIWMRLPRAGIAEIIAVLQEADKRASNEYVELIRRMNKRK